VVLPSKPLSGKVSPAASKSAATEVPRRSALSSIVAALCSPVVIAWSAFIGSMTVSALATARFMMPNVLVEPPTKFKIGPPNDYAPGTVSTKWQAQFNIWVVNGDIDGVQMIYALSTVCTHLGCTPNWLEGEQKFKCPCHGSGFYKTGVNFEGPAPRPLSGLAFGWPKMACWKLIKRQVSERAGSVGKSFVLCRCDIVRGLRLAMDCLAEVPSGRAATRVAVRVD